MGIMNKLGVIAQQLGLGDFMRASHAHRGSGSSHLCRPVGKGKSIDWRGGKYHASQCMRAGRRKAKQKGRRG